MSFIIIYVTYKNIREAEKIISHLLKNRLITSSMLFPISSYYWWKGKLIKSNEIISILETQSKNWLKIKSEIIKMHSYELPCIIKQKVDADKKYEQWISKETNNFF
jgi:periplasmic divalent cation tolerance protein